MYVSMTVNNDICLPCLRFRFYMTSPEKISPQVIDNEDCGGICVNIRSVRNLCRIIVQQRKKLVNGVWYTVVIKKLDAIS